MFCLYTYICIKLCQSFWNNKSFELKSCSCYILNESTRTHKHTDNKKIIIINYALFSFISSSFYFFHFGVVINYIMGFAAATAIAAAEYIYLFVYILFAFKQSAILILIFLLDMKFLISFSLFSICFLLF